MDKYRLKILIIVIIVVAAGFLSLKRFQPASNTVNERVTLNIESWRTDDLRSWRDTIIPAFEAEHPDIQIVFSPSPPSEYNASLNAKLIGGTAGDIITCRPFDASLNLFKRGNLLSLELIDGLTNFSTIAKTAWTTDDGNTTFCVPVASVIHGFLYNKSIWDQYGFDKPTNKEQFFAILDQIEKHDEFTPMALGTNDQWEAATMGFQNIGPNYWKGELGRLMLLNGQSSFKDTEYVSVFEELQKWSAYLGDGYKAQSYPQTQVLFSLGRAVIYPTGSWDIATFRRQADFDIGAFKPPIIKTGDECYISDHPDIGIGVNPASENREAALVFINWLTSKKFAELYANSIPGFIPLSNHEVNIEDPLVNEFISWRDECSSTIRNSYHILSRGTPNLENEIWNVSAQLLNKTITPKDAAKQLDDGLNSWYVPNQKHNDK